MHFSVFYYFFYKSSILQWSSALICDNNLLNIRADVKCTKRT